MIGGTPSERFAELSDAGAKSRRCRASSDASRMGCCGVYFRSYVLSAGYRGRQQLSKLLGLVLVGLYFSARRCG